MPKLFSRTVACFRRRVSRVEGTERESVVIYTHELFVGLGRTGMEECLGTKRCCARATLKGANKRFMWLHGSIVCGPPIA